MLSCSLATDPGIVVPEEYLALDSGFMLRDSADAYESEFLQIQQCGFVVQVCKAARTNSLWHHTGSRRLHAA